jgi:ribonuclease P protein component
MKYQFKKPERLYGKKSIDALFSGGRSFFIFPFRIMILENGDTEEYQVRVLLSVSKKIHKTAVARNKIKRMMREAYRLNKHQLHDSLDRKNGCIHLAMIYMAKDVLPYIQIEKSMAEVFNRMGKINPDR